MTSPATIIAFIAALLQLAAGSRGVGEAWELVQNATASESSSGLSSHHHQRHRVIGSSSDPEVPTISGKGRHMPVHSSTTTIAPSSTTTPKTEELGPGQPRGRRESGDGMEKIVGIKSFREARMNGGPEIWSAQPIGVQMRRRLSSAIQTTDREQHPVDDVKYPPGGPPVGPSLPPPVPLSYSAKTDYVPVRHRAAPLGYRPGLPLDHPQLLGPRESRDMPPAQRSYPDEFDTPIFQNVVREHDFEIQLPKHYGYYPLPPGRYRNQREYYYRPQQQYHPGDPREPELPEDIGQDYDGYSGRPPRVLTPKRKRIIYYATLPEVVRKPEHPIRNTYSSGRPYEPLVPLPPLSDLVVDRTNKKVLPAGYEHQALGNPRRPIRYDPYDQRFDPYVKRASYPERRMQEDERARELPGAESRRRLGYSDLERYADDEGHGDDRRIGGRLGGRQERRDSVPYPVHIDTEVNVKEAERIPGRKIFAQIDNNYDRYDGERVKKTVDSQQQQQQHQEQLDEGSEKVEEIK